MMTIYTYKERQEPQGDFRLQDQRRNRSSSNRELSPALHDFYQIPIIFSDVHPENASAQSFYR